MDFMLILGIKPSLVILSQKSTCIIKINGGEINQQNYNCYSFDSLKTQQIHQIVHTNRLDVPSVTYGQLVVILAT